MLHQSNPYLYKLRYLVGGTIAIATVFLLVIFVSAATASSASTTSPAPSASAATIDDNPNIIASGFGDAANALGQRASIAGDSLSSSLYYEASAFSHSGKFMARTSVAVAGGVGHGLLSTAHAIGSGVVFTVHIPGKTIGLVSHTSNLSNILQPTDNTPTPTITQLRAQQATLIQSGTQEVSVTALTTGTGGACDSGSGNGGYPMSWCNAPMDTLQTVSYSSDHINRECTSYAYWYFTSIEGHTDLRVTGNAKYWAGTSSYPTYTTPAVGAIAVETAGYYGHVAIVQALPGQTYAGQVVPAGNVLISEMNYDWNGHFRYSYSPLNKFSAYIY